MSRPPRAWIAVLLSLLAPGLGHVYSGRWLRALAVVALLELLVLAANLLFAAGPIGLGVLVLGPLAGIAVAVAIAVDAARAARRGRVRFFRRSALVGASLLFVLVSVIVGEIIDPVRRRSVGEAYRIPSASMQPTLLIGDHFVSNPLAYRTREPERGDVVVVFVERNGRPAEQTQVKRIVGLPGDTIEFRGARLWIGGVERTAASVEGTSPGERGEVLRVHSESFDGRSWRILDSESVALPDFGPFVVEPGRFFVAGDNRDHSKDSRSIGTLPREQILAPVSSIYWSWDFNGGIGELLRPARVFALLRDDTRWERIGTDVNRRSAAPR